MMAAGIFMEPAPIMRAIVCLAVALLAPSAAAQNPLARSPPPPQSLVNGVWNGVDLERRSNCTLAQNNGQRGTYAQFDVAADASGNFTIGQTGITSLNCTYFGRYVVSDGALSVQGDYNCTDGKRGSFATRSIQVDGTTLTVRMDIQLTGTESCSIEAILGMSRFFP